MYEHLASYLPEILIALFSVSITMAGLIAVFVVFRYQLIDNYVDSWKSVLRKLLKNEKPQDYILYRIQNIGKNRRSNKVKYRECDDISDMQYFRDLDEDAAEFVDDILRVRKDRDDIRKCGFGIIITWALLAFVYLFISFWFPICNHCITFIVNIIVIALFVGSIIFTLVLIYKSLNPNKKEV